jgi:hypothetical protein
VTAKNEKMEKKGKQERTMGNYCEGGSLSGGLQRQGVMEVEIQVHF